MNLILEKTSQVYYFTEIGSVLRALGVSATDYDWYLSDLETNHVPSGFEITDQWISGEALDRLVSEHEIQFIWGVFSAVPAGFRCTVESAPFVYGNSRYWKEPDCKPQLECALFEIAGWDSSATILIGVPPQAAASFLRAYPDATPLGR